MRFKTTALFLLTASFFRPTMSSPGFLHSGLDTVQVNVHNVTIDGLDLFYRQAGDPTNPTFLLLHGYPSSSHQFRNLMPLLATKYHVLAPDYPGFGFTDVPASRHYNYTFDNLAETIELFLAKLNVESYIIYIFDYGAPVGMRLALRNSSAILAIVSQNGNTYVDGLGPGIQPLLEYGKDPTNKTIENQLRAFNTYEGAKSQYLSGTPDPSIVEPESYTLDAALLAKPGNEKIQLAYFRDYISNVALYPRFQAYLRETQPPVLAVWGANDMIFTPPGAQAFKKDVPPTDVSLLDGGHFLLETKLLEVAALILGFLATKGL